MGRYSSRLPSVLEEGDGFEQFEDKEYLYFGTTANGYLVYDATTFLIGTLISGTTLTLNPLNANTKIGTGSPSYLTPASGNLFVGGALEVVGLSYFRTSKTQIAGSSIFNNNIAIRFGTSTSNSIWLFKTTTQTPNVFWCGLEDDSLSMIIGKSTNYSGNYGHALQSNPTLWVHSSTPSATATDQWGSLVHDTADFKISSGKGRVLITPFTGSTLKNASTIGQEILGTSAYYLGDPATDGTWRVNRSGNNLIFERLESSIWVTKSTISA